MADKRHSGTGDMADKKDIEVKKVGDGANEEIDVESNNLVSKVKELATDGSATRLRIRNEDGRELIDVPLPVGAAGIAVGVLLAPTLAAVGAIAALLTRVKIEIERETDEPDDS